MSKIQMLGLTLVCIGNLNGAAAAAGAAGMGAVDFAVLDGGESYGPYRDNPEQFMMDLDTILYDGEIPKEITSEKFTYILEAIAEQRRGGRLKDLPEKFTSLLLNMVHTPYLNRYITTNSVRALVAAGANVNLQDKTGKTALMNAVLHNNTEIVRVLVAARADLNLKDYYGWTALSEAAKEGYTEIVRVLIAAGADPDTLTPEQRARFAQEIEDGLRIWRERVGGAAAAGTQ